MLLLASIMIWVVIFNHRAESPTFIIAITGVALWYYAQQQKPENYVLLVLAFVFHGPFTHGSFPKIYPK